MGNAVDVGGTDVTVAVCLGVAVDVGGIGTTVAVGLGVAVDDATFEGVPVGEGVAVGLAEPPHAANNNIDTPQNAAKCLLIRVFISESSALIY